MLNWYPRGFKRLFDVCLSGLGLLIFALPAAAIAWRIRWSMGSPVLFRQTRIGYRGRPFEIFKFRTMNREGTIVSGLGRKLRETAMDEMPQLLNILRGEMSFVGPRPLIPNELKDLHQIAGGSARLSMRPGLAGAAQLRSDKAPSLQDRLRMDLEYVQQCSLGLDLKILFTSLAVTFRGGWEKPGPKIRKGSL